MLRCELAKRSWKKETVVIGAATDPYQPAEGRFKLTRKCLEALRDFSNPAGLITRGPMIVRDIDVLTELAKRADLGVTFSIPTIDMDVWRKTEPGTAPPQQRLRAIEKLVAAGIKASVGMAPILPGLSDRPEQIEAVVKAARAAGATGVWGGMLHLRPGTREHFMTVLQRHWPELVPEYERMYRDRPYLPAALAEPSMREVARLRDIHQVRDRRPIRLQPPPPPKQLSLLT
ncbi:MAG: radical SAM protein [Chloroflexi bacterium]|nr:MAG: radical SAM protein [Chloroflexota bacterium]